jgi:phosphotransferase system  glucose/maltose/N-acetylglucosamine-specific IIC component
LIGASIAHNLTLSLTKGYKTQDISIKAFNDFSSFNFTASVTAKPDDDSSESTIIIIIIILCAIVFVFFLFYIFSIARKKKQPTEERESLIT